MSLTINLEHPLYVGFKLVFREQTGVKYPLSETNHLRKNGCCISGISTSIHVTDLFTFKQKSIICYTINVFFHLAETSFKYAIANCASESILEHINKDVTKSLFEHEMSSIFVDRSFCL